VAGGGVATPGVKFDHVARDFVVPGLIVPGLIVPGLLVRNLVAPGLVAAGVVAACAPEAESAGAGAVGAVGVIGVGGMVALVGPPAEFPPATSSLPGVLAGGPLEGLNNPPAVVGVVVVTVAREVRLASMAAPVRSTRRRAPVSDEELLATSSG
jgi:hypothetical protein